MSEEETKTEEAPEEPSSEGIKDTDTLPSEAKKPKGKTKAKAKEKASDPEKKPEKKKIIGLMGIEHDEGPPGSTHG